MTSTLAGSGFSGEEPPGGADEVEVRFDTAIARWIRERYPDHRVEADGSVVVTFRTASIDWLVRHVLRFGDQAVVIAPDAVSRGGEAGGGGRQS